MNKSHISVNIYTNYSIKSGRRSSLKQRYTLRNLIGFASALKLYYFLPDITERLKYKIHTQTSIWFPVLVVEITVKEIKREPDRERQTRPLLLNNCVPNLFQLEPIWLIILLEEQANTHIHTLAHAWDLSPPCRGAWWGLHVRSSLERQCMEALLGM